MAVNGKIVDWDAVRFTVSSTGSGSHAGIGTGKHGHSTTASTFFALNPVDFPEGISLSCGGDSESDEWSVTYTGPDAPTGETWTGSGWASVSAEIIISDLKIYNTGVWKLVGVLSVYVNGVKMTTIGSSGDVILDETSGNKGPAYVPIIGVPWGGSGTVSAAQYDVPFPLPDVYERCTETTGTHFIGWAFREHGGDWEDLPVALAPGNAPAMGGGCTDPGLGGISVSDTYGATITSYAKDCKSRVLDDSGAITECITECVCPNGATMQFSQIQDPPVPWDVYKVETEEIGRGASVRLIPNLNRAIKRFNNDYAALWYRDEFPSATAIAAWACDNNGVITGGSSEPTVYSNLSVMLSLATNSADIIEAPLSIPCYSPWGASGTRSHTIEYEYEGGSPILCAEEECPAPLPGEPPAECIQIFLGDWEPIEDEAYSSSRSYSFPHAVGTQIAAYLDHAAALARLSNSWWNPLWSFGLYTDDWSLDGAPVDWVDYWELVGSQHLYNGSLPDTELLGIRNHLIDHPLTNSSENSFLASFFGNVRWLGISRWQTKAVTPRASFEYDSSSSTLWESDDGSLSFDGSGITLTP